FLEVNESFLATTGRARQDLTGSTPHQAGLLVNPADYDQMLTDLNAGKPVRNRTLRLLDGNAAPRATLRSLAPLAIGDGPCLLAAALPRQLLAFSRKQVVQTKSVHFNSVIGRMESMLSRLIGETIELEQDLAAHLPDVMADEGNLEQVLLNLVVNARDAMPKGGRVRI